MQMVEFGYDLWCPHCGTKLIGLEEVHFSKCPHVVFIYSWADGDPDSFVFARPDYANAFLNSLKESEHYLTLIRDEEYEPITEQVEKAFLDGKVMLDDTSTRIASYCSSFPEKMFPNLLSEGATIFAYEHYHSGIHVAIDMAGI